MNLVNFKLDQDADGIVTLVWDMPGKPMNVLDQSLMDELDKIVEHVSSDASIKGVVLTSGKDAFCAGADLTMMEGAGKEFAAAAKARGEEAAMKEFAAQAGRARLSPISASLV